jgi:DNA-binding MarR family transcriptional regulator
MHRRRELALYRLIGDTHTLDGLPRAAQAFIRAADSIRRTLAAEAGVSGTELRALSYIAEASTITPRVLAEFLEMSTPAVSSATNTLVRRGLVVRSENPRDRRSLLLELTPEGHQLMEATYTAFQSAILSAAGSIDADQEGQLEQNLLTLAHEMDETPVLFQIGGPGPGAPPR